MNKIDLQYIYGPVPSWRLGSSLGIDPISRSKKICSFDCTYCQLGKTEIFSDQRQVFVPTNKIIEEFKLVPLIQIDYITFSGVGEPTLASNLGEAIRGVKEIRKERIAVLTNSSLIDRDDVKRDLLLADLVV
ncbi:radical SAM protein, partial [Candidatus Omnitrophota bacterium]